MLAGINPDCNIWYQYYVNLIVSYMGYLFHNVHILLLHSKGSFNYVLPLFHIVVVVLVQNDNNFGMEGVVNFKKVDIFPFVAQYGRLPIELAARRDCMEEVEILFPLTSPIPTIPNWSIDGIISHAKSESAKPLVHYLLLSPCR